MSSFHCIKCGACCRFLHLYPPLAAYDRGDGVCKHLTADNLCKIYEDRPRLCRIDQMRPEVMTDREWNRRNVEGCERLHLQVYGQPMSSVLDEKRR